MYEHWQKFLVEDGNNFEGYVVSVIVLLLIIIHELFLYQLSHCVFIGYYIDGLHFFTSSVKLFCYITLSHLLP